MNGTNIMSIKVTKRDGTLQEFDLDKEVKRIVRKKTNQQLDRFSTIYFNKIKKDITINEF